jgi:hypothetical protein
MPRPLFTRLPFDYRRVPEPVRSRLLDIAAIASRRQPAFPRWPIEESIDPLPSGIDYAGKRFAVVLTHDIDSRGELDLIEPIRAQERNLGLRSSWGFVPETSWPSDRLAESLSGEGCQVYWHDLRHDGRTAWLSTSDLRARIAATDKTSRWAKEITTFRSGQLLMSPTLLDVIADRFAIDSSIPDTERGGPYGSVVGCGSVVPFRLRGLLELPVTMPQDYFMERVFGLQPRAIFDLWTRKLEHIARVGGVAVLNTHPIWVNPVEPSRVAMWAMYRRFLELVVSRDDVLIATPDEIRASIRPHAPRLG